MKIAEIIGLTDELRPNEYTAEMKTRWLSEVEGTVVDEILNRAEGNSIIFDGYCYAADQERCRTGFRTSISSTLLPK